MICTCTLCSVVHMLAAAMLLPPAADKLPQVAPEKMQEQLIDTFWANPAGDWRDERWAETPFDQFWQFGRTGTFTVGIERPDGSIGRGSFPEGFPEGHTMFQGNWVIRDDGLRLSNIHPAKRWQPGAQPKQDEQATSDVTARVSIAWADAKRTRLLIDGKPYGVMPAVGGAPLHNLDELRTYIARGQFSSRMRGSDVVRTWAFDPEGTFFAEHHNKEGGDETGIASQLPADAVRIHGRWDVAHDPPEDLDLVFSLNANASQLILREVHVQGGVDDGRIIDQLVVPLGWVDGKLRIEIDGTVYMRGVPR